jgi:hypothetical protein
MVSFSHRDTPKGKAMGLDIIIMGHVCDCICIRKCARLSDGCYE